MRGAPTNRTPHKINAATARANEKFFAILKYWTACRAHLVSNKWPTTNAAGGSVKNSAPRYITTSRHFRAIASPRHASLRLHTLSSLTRCPSTSIASARAVGVNHFVRALSATLSGRSTVSQRLPRPPYRASSRTSSARRLSSDLSKRFSGAPPFRRAAGFSRF